jgi:hypothetical protein
MALLATHIHASDFLVFTFQIHTKVLVYLKSSSVMKSKSISIPNLLSVISSINIFSTDSNNYHQYEIGGKI